MLDFLFAVGQFFCVLGLLYGLFLVLAHGDCVDSLRRHYDPVIGHEMTRDELTSAPPTAAERRARPHRDSSAPAGPPQSEPKKVRTTLALLFCAVIATYAATFTPGWLDVPPAAPIVPDRLDPGVSDPDSAASDPDADALPGSVAPTPSGAP